MKKTYKYPESIRENDFNYIKSEFEELGLSISKLGFVMSGIVQNEMELSVDDLNEFTSDTDMLFETISDHLSHMKNIRNQMLDKFEEV